MKIIVDSTGGECGSGEVIKGILNARQEINFSVVFLGNKVEITNELKKSKNIQDKIEIIDCKEIIKDSDDPVDAIRHKKSSSIPVGLKLLAESKADAFVSAGSTGALIVGSSLIIKRIKGVRRVALAPLIPSENGHVLLLDAGANSECTPKFLVQFGYMGHIYINKMFNIESPRVALLNIGIEDNKGTELTIEANKLLKRTKLNYIGNIESRDIRFGKARIIVCDGFTGNVVLKQLEGDGKLFYKLLKKFFMKNWITKLGALILKKEFDNFKRSFDFNEYSGSPILGLTKPVIKIHGSSDARAFCCAVKQAISFVRSDVISEIEQNIHNFEDDETE